MRVLISFSVLHLILALFMLLRNRASKIMNEELFFFKLVLLAGSVVGLMFVPNRYLSLIPMLARYPALLYLVYQNICLLDLGFKGSEYLWTKNLRRRNSSFFAMSMCIAFFCFVFLAAVSTFLNWFYFFQSDCGWNIATLASSTLVSLLIILFGFLGSKKHTHFATGAWIAFVFSLLTGSLLTSTFQSGCNPYDRKGDANYFFFQNSLRLIVDLGIGFLAVCFASLSTETSQALSDANLVYIRSHDTNSLDLSKSLDETFDEEAIRVSLRMQFNDSKIIYFSDSFLTFHLIVFLFSSYLLCAFFQWGSLDVFRDEIWGGTVLASQEAFFAKAFSGVVLIFLYVWVVIVQRYHQT